MKTLALIGNAIVDLFLPYLPQLRKRQAFGFLVHPRDTKDITRKYHFLGWLSEKQADFFLWHLWPVTLSKIRGLKSVHTGKEIHGYVISSPLTAAQMKRDPERARKSIIKAAKLAERRGAKIIGLGALTASLTKGGLDIMPHVRSDLTTGRIYTSKIIVDTVCKAEGELGLERNTLRVAIVGAAGSIGTASAQILVRRGFRHLLFLDLPRKRDRMEWLEQKVKDMDSGVTVEISHDMRDLKKTNVIIAVTNAPEVVIRSEHLASGAIIVDDAQPTDVDMEVIEKRNDVLVLEGGVAHADHVNTHFNFGLRHKHDMYSCLAEAVILAGMGQEGHYSVGAVSDLDFELLDKIEADAEKLGIHVGELQNVHKVYNDDDFERIRSFYRSISVSIPNFIEEK